MDNENTTNANTASLELTGGTLVPAGSQMLTLPSGRIAVISEFLGRHVREAQRIITDGKDSGSNGADSMTFVCIALCTTINGRPVVAEELDDMPGGDVLELMGKFSAANFRD